jgi:voltage-gated potassium channel
MKAEFVVLESDEQNCDEMEALGYLYLRGDATKDDMLLAAGVKRAKGLVSVLAGDAENVFTTLSAKVINPEIFIVARAIEDETEIKLRRAGATRVVKPYEIGGIRMAQVLLRPHVMDFIDQIARQKNMDLSLEEIGVGSHSSLAGKKLSETDIRSRLNIIIVAIHKEKGDFVYNPGPSTVIEKGDQLLAIGAREQLEELYSICFRQE